MLTSRIPSYRSLMWVAAVPQESVLGPLLFIIQMSHIDAQPRSTTVRSFADMDNRAHSP